MVVSGHVCCSEKYESLSQLSLNNGSILSYVSSHTINYSLCDLVIAVFFTLLYFLLVILLFTMGSKPRA